MGDDDAPQTNVEGGPPLGAALAPPSDTWSEPHPPPRPRARPRQTDPRARGAARRSSGRTRSQLS